MTTEQAWVAASGAVAFLAIVLAVLAHRRARRSESFLAVVLERVARLEAATEVAAQPAVEDARGGTFVITAIGSAEPAAQVPVAREIDGRLFVDIVARESVVKAASWAHGLRRALSSTSRDRIRLEVRRETRRAGRDRRAETKQALREFRARERAATPAREVGEDVA